MKIGDEIIINEGTFIVSKSNTHDSCKGCAGEFCYTTCRSFSSDCLSGEIIFKEVKKEE